MVDPFANFSQSVETGRQLEGNPMEAFVNQLVQRFNQHQQLQQQMNMQLTMAPELKKRELIGEFQAYQSPEAKALYGGSPFGTPGNAPMAVGQGGGGFLQTKMTRKTPFGEMTYENPQAEAQRSAIQAQQEARQPLSTKEFSAVGEKMKPQVKGNVFPGGFQPLEALHLMPNLYAQNAAKLAPTLENLDAGTFVQRLHHSMLNNWISPKEYQQLLQTYHPEITPEELDQYLQSLSNG